LHDGARQRVVSVRIRLGLLAERLPGASERGLLDRAGRELESALAEIRSVTRDGRPELLVQRGIVACLRSLASDAPIEVTVEAQAVGRYPERIERNVYFSCVEALQNVVKHAGRRAVARIRLAERRKALVFEVEDSGV